jgi:hypothetical protein
MTDKIDVVDMSSELDGHYLEVCRLAEDCSNLASQADLSLDRLRKTDSYEVATVEVLSILHLAEDVSLLSQIALLEVNMASELVDESEIVTSPELLAQRLLMCRLKEAYVEAVQAQSRCSRILAEATLALAERTDRPTRDELRA